MSDLISKKAVIDLFEKYQPYMAVSVYEFGMALKALPSAQPKRKAGHWEFQGYQMFSCTCCSYIASQEQLESWGTKETDSAFPLFCPNCGADMRGEKDE